MKKSTYRIIFIVLFITLLFWIVNHYFPILAAEPTTNLAFVFFTSLIAAITLVSGYLSLVPRRTDELPIEIDSKVILRNRNFILKAIWDTWIEGILYQSLHHKINRIELSIERETELVHHPWDMDILSQGKDEKHVSSNLSINQIFNEANESLLILGAPGSGKTTLLLELAEDKIRIANNDLVFPVPVFLKLSSWTPRYTFLEWLKIEINKRYLIPEVITHLWVDKGSLILLLDGLDEVEETYREACVKSINNFRMAHNLPIAITSRQEEYNSLGDQLKVWDAIKILPLTKEQVDNFLTASGSGLSILWEVLQNDPALQAFANTPLFLSVMVLTYRNAPEEVVRELGVAVDYRKRLFDDYIDAMFRQRGNKPTYSKEQTRMWLGWLARVMMLFDQDIFYVEDISPNKIGYPLGKIFKYVSFFFDEIPFSPRIYKWSWKEFGRAYLSFLSSGLRVLLLATSIMTIFLSIFLLFNKGFFYLRHSIIPILIVAFFYGLLVSLIVPIAMGIMEGFHLGIITHRFRPGEWIWQSLFNSLKIGFVTAIFLTSPIILLFINLSYQIKLGVVSGLVIIFIVFLSLFALYKGGIYSSFHYLTRWKLFYNKCLPWKIVNFLEFSREHGFLNRAGGGYIFIHGLLMEYFANSAEQMDYSKVMGNATRVIQEQGEKYLERFLYVEAIDRFNKAIELEKNNTFLYYLRGHSYLLLKQFENAVEDFNKSIELDENFALSRLTRGVTFRTMGMPDKAIDEFNTCLRFDKKLNNGIYWNPNLRQLGVLGQSAVITNRILLGRFQPRSDPYYQLFLAHWLLDKRKDSIQDLIEARKRGEKAHKYHRQGWVYHFKLALYYLAEGNILKANRFYQEGCDRCDVSKSMFSAIMDLEDYLTVFPDSKLARDWMEKLREAKERIDII